MSRLVGPRPRAQPETTLSAHLFEGRGSIDPEAEPSRALARRRPWLVVHRGRDVESYGRDDVAHLARRWAAALREVGVGPGDRVALLLPNGARFVSAFFGAARLGAAAVPLPWPFFLDRVDRHLASLRGLVERARPRAVVTTPRVAALEPFDLPLLVEPSAPPDPGPDRSRPDGIAFVQLTSGTTASPRGALITHRAVVASVLGMGQALGLGAGDVGVSWLPLFHVMGLVGSLLTSLAYDFPLHLMSPSELMLHPKRWLEVASRARATVTVAPNFAYAYAARRVRSLERLDLRALRLALDGSEPVTRAAVDAFEGRFGPVGLRRGVVRPVYGLAENTLGAAFAGPKDPDLLLGGRPVPSVGEPLEGMTIAIRGPDGRDLPVGEEGAIWLRGPALMEGYLDEPAATRSVLADGWLRTGDLGVIADGRLYVTGREKEIVIKAGQKYRPDEIECVIRDALEPEPSGVAAFSVAGEASEILAIVVEIRTGGTEALARRLRGRVQEALGVRADIVRFVPPGTLPRTTSGKIRRQACVQLLEVPA